MAVMATPPPLDQTTFAPGQDLFAPPEMKMQPVPSADQDAMAVDTDFFDGTTTEIHDPLFDDPSESVPQSATNGDLNDHSMDATAHANEAAHLSNGAITAGSNMNAPVTEVSSGIAPTAPFLSSLPSHEDALLDPIAETTTPIIATSVEQSLSEVRDEPHPTEDIEEPEAMDTTEGDADLFGDGDQILDADASLAQVSTPEDQVKDSGAHLSATGPEATSLPSRPASNGPEARTADAPSSGQVRPREEDEEEDGPLAKRARTDDTEDASATINPTSLTAASATTNGNRSMAPPATDNYAELKKPLTLDSNPMSDLQKKFLQEKVRTALKTKAALPFSAPVDAEALNIPTYYQTIEHPMDLATLLSNLKSDKYASVDAFLKDFQQMVNNSFLFNGPDHPVTQLALSLRSYFHKMMEKLPKGPQRGVAEKKPKKQAAAPKAEKPRRESRGGGHARSPSNISPQNTFPPDPITGVPLIRRDSSALDGRPKREIHRPPPRDLPYASAKPKRKKYQLELKFARSVVDSLLERKHMDYSYPFLHPVDPVALNIPTYHKIIKKPMDMGTINRNLKNDAYTQAKEVYGDVKLMFDNCYKFNPESDAVNQMGKRYEKVFDRLWEEKDAWIERERSREITDNSPLPSDDEGSEEEEDEEEDDKAEKIRLLQEQVRALTGSIQALAAEPGRKKSPKIGAKKGSKKSGGVKPSKKNSLSLPPLAKPPRKAAPKVLPQVSLQQKREISEIIGNFDEIYMNEAVAIIKKGYPQGAAQGEEMELDVEELPNPVLHDLLKLCRKFQRANNIKTAVEDVDEDDAYEPPVSHRASTSSKPRKNKPMNKHEQEAKIAELEAQLGQHLGNGISGSEGSPAQGQEETDDDDDDAASASESEEE